MIELLSRPDAWAAFLTLTTLELVLGIDNIVFITILADRLPEGVRDRIRKIGLALALVLRIALLFTLSWMMRLDGTVFEIGGFDLSGRDLILLFGGLFLLWKSTREVHQLLEGEEGHATKGAAVTVGGVLVQIMLIDVVFSLDSIITAVGMVDELPIMVAAVVTAVALMILASGPVARFVTRHPTVKMLALSFLFMIGMVLVADGLGHHVPKGYIYFAMTFSLLVEMLNLRMRSRVPPVDLREPYSTDSD